MCCFRNGRGPLARGIERDASPGQNMSSLLGEIFGGPMLQLASVLRLGLCGWRLDSLMLEGHCGDGERAGTLYLWKLFLQPGEA